MKLFILLVVFSLISCYDANIPQPRPHQYPKIEFPDRTYTFFENEECPFTFVIPDYAKLVKKELLFDDIKANPCWFDLELSLFAATIHFSYYAIGSSFNLDKLINDAFTMASKHNVKASFREEFIIKNQSNSSGLIFKINGPVATPYQFYITDSTHHFLRGSLYFNEKINIDSISPIVEYVELDIDKMLNSLQWQ